ncbi:hypothetical protein GF345_05985 [Candidatus Woesearchaeota archaeon]|nr:hypothetical protein [Candidatus Woesearchaeota archaeon]
MRRFAFTWVIIMLLFMALIVFAIARPTITGGAVMDSQSDSIPPYMMSFIVLLMVLFFLVMFLVGAKVHSDNSRVKEEDSMKELMNRMQR